MMCGRTMNSGPLESQGTPFQHLRRVLALTIDGIYIVIMCIIRIRGWAPWGCLALHEAAAPVVEAAESILAQHELRAEPTIADDAANLRALFSRLPIPRADADLGPLPGLRTLRGARGVLYQEFDEVLRAARGLGWQASDPALMGLGGTEIAKDQSLARMLETLVARMETVEQLLDESVTPEGEPAAGRTNDSDRPRSGLHQDREDRTGAGEARGAREGRGGFFGARLRRGKHLRTDDGFPRDRARHPGQDDAGSARSERATAAPGSSGGERIQDSGRESCLGP